MAKKYLTGFDKVVSLANMSDTTKYHFNDSQSVQHITWNGDKYQRVFSLTKIDYKRYQTGIDTQWKTYDINILGAGVVELYHGDGSDTWEVDVLFNNGVSKIEHRCPSIQYSNLFRLYDSDGNLFYETEYTLYHNNFEIRSTSSGDAYTFEEI